MPVRQCNRQLSMKQPKCVTWLKCSGHEIANTFLDFPQVYTLSPQVRDWRKGQTSKPGPDSDSDPDSKKIRTREKPGPGLEQNPD
jgi:hypothetical protein